MAFQAQEGQPEIRVRVHFKAPQLVWEDLPGLELVDGNVRSDIQDNAITGVGLQQLRWWRYEVKSNLVYPDSLARFVRHLAGINSAEPYVSDMLACWRYHFPPVVVKEPLGNHDLLNYSKARTLLLPALLEAAGIRNLPYTRYHEIAAQMLPEEIHPEVSEMLDAICRAFGVEP